MTLPAPTDEWLARLAQTIIYKAARFFVALEAPLGMWGEMTEFGQAVIRRDYMTDELLKGMHLPDWTIVDIGTLVTVEDVIRAGLQADPATFPTARIPDVQRALDAALSWLDTEIYHPFGVA
jgi:hypothetical protein